MDLALSADATTRRPAGDSCPSGTSAPARGPSPAKLVGTEPPALTPGLPRPGMPAPNRLGPPRSALPPSLPPWPPPPPEPGSAGKSSLCMANSGCRACAYDSGRSAGLPEAPGPAPKTGKSLLSKRGPVRGGPRSCKPRPMAVKALGTPEASAEPCGPSKSTRESGFAPQLPVFARPPSISGGRCVGCDTERVIPCGARLGLIRQLRRICRESEVPDVCERARLGIPPGFKLRPWEKGGSRTHVSALAFRFAPKVALCGVVSVRTSTTPLSRSAPICAAWPPHCATRVPCTFQGAASSLPAPRRSLASSGSGRWGCSEPLRTARTSSGHRESVGARPRSGPPAWRFLGRPRLELATATASASQSGVESARETLCHKRDIAL
eukprot:scaffold2664_cov267-Pinguiococcus_pyrenoidosus.AAC.8